MRKLYLNTTYKNNQIIRNEVELYLVNFMANLIAKNPHEKEFHQAVREVVESLAPFLLKNPVYTMNLRGGGCQIAINHEKYPCLLCRIRNSTGRICQLRERCQCRWVRKSGRGDAGAGVGVKFVL